MDYTLCEYVSPDMDILAFNLAREFLVSRCGHPPQVSQLEFDPTFPVRGAWYDRDLGNLLLVDIMGHILQCHHGIRLYFIFASELYSISVSHANKIVFFNISLELYF